MASVKAEDLVAELAVFDAAVREVRAVVRRMNFPGHRLPVHGGSRHEQRLPGSRVTADERPARHVTSGSALPVESIPETRQGGVAKDLRAGGAHFLPKDGFTEASRYL